jgi:ribosome maturation factor RimP
MDIKERLKTAIEKDVISLGYIFWGLEISGSSRSKLIRLYIDNNDTSINLSDCEKVSNQTMEILNNSDFLDFSFRLEVSSPGIDRTFFDFNQHKAFLGNQVEIKFMKENTKQTLRGILIKAEDDFLEVKKHNEDLEKISSSNYLSSKLIYMEQA